MTTTGSTQERKKTYTKPHIVWRATFFPTLCLMVVALLTCFATSGHAQYVQFPDDPINPDVFGEMSVIAPGASCGPNVIWDCAANCVSLSTAQSWIGDGYCDDGYWGMDLRCLPFDYDQGDCPGVEHADTCSNAEIVSVGYPNTTTGQMIGGGKLVNGNIEFTFEAAIDTPGDADWFEIHAPGWAWAVTGITTSGTTDTYGALYSGCGQSAFTQDDNSGSGTNFGIVKATAPDETFLLRVTHAKPGGTGSYTLKIVLDPLL